MRLKDGTKIIELYENKPNKGYKLDQIILFDDERQLIKWDRYDFINYIMRLVKFYSCVPDKFKILEYEDIR